MTDEIKRAEPRDPRVEAALREYFERLDRGEPIDREKFIARHAPIADQLRSFIAAEDEVRKLAGAEPPLDRAHDSTQSFAGHGQETIAPQSVAKRNAESGESGLTGQFGRYRIIRALGEGAMGAVYLAEDTQLERSVAIKTPHFTENPTEESLERFYREARVAATLRQPNICPVFDVGQIDGKHYISMAYIEGRPLSAFIHPEKPQTERQILIVIRKLALALHEAHDHGIVHRDLKPANIMVDKKGEPIIMDFGLAQQTRREGDIRLTQTGNIIGTPAYMSPEQVEGEPDKIGPPTDQYSLGVILYELLTAQLPFRGSVIAVMGQILTKEVTPPSQSRPDLDPRIQAVCLKMIAKTPSGRFASLKSVADELATILKSPAVKAASKEQPASTLAGSSSDRLRADVGASQVLKSLKPKAVTESDLASLEELARKCYSRRDYDQVIQIVERVPEERRTPGLQAQLEKARDKADQIAFVICEIDEAVRLNDRQTALKKAEELLKIKPGHHRALQVQEAFSGYGKGGAARIGPVWQFTQPWSEGGWVPWSVLAFGMAVFGVMLYGITIYLRSGNTVVKVEINDPGVGVTVKGTTVTLKGPAKEEVKIEPGEKELTITYAGLETVTKSFTIKKGQTRIVTVSIVDAKVVATFDNEVLPLTQAHEEKTTATVPPTFKNSLGMEFVLVPKGKSWLGGGGGKPGNREVEISDDFYLGKYEVTQEEWWKANGTTPSHFSRTGGGKDMVKDNADAELERFPVENVSRDDAQVFLERLNKGEKDAGWVYRLPKEAEWEYACRGGPLSDKLDTAYDFYFDKPTNQLLPEQANFNQGLKRTCKVGSYKPNRLGLYDMHGNVWEWCHDVEKTADGASSRAYRGGCWQWGSDQCRAANRNTNPPSMRVWDVGLRVARVPVGKRGAPHSPDAAKQADTAAVKPNAPHLLVAPFDEATAKKGQEAWAGHLKTRVELSNAIGMKLALIPPGEFQMGSDDTRLPADTRPVHRVRITNPFYIGIYEVTQAEFQRVMGANPSQFRDDPRLPVESMSWENIQGFCRKLSAMPEEKQAGRTYRVPTEAEWEYACRAGTGTLFHFGEVMSSEAANFDGDHPGLDLPHGPNLGRTTRVGFYRPNSFGLYDMHGNVIEVVSDFHSADYYSTGPMDDPQGPTSGDQGIGRGGGWRNPGAPSAYRFAGPRSTVDSVVGFRVVYDMAASAVAGASTASSATAPVATDGFVPIFNGKDLSGWKTDPSQPGNWRVENGMLMGSGPAPSNLYSTRGDFKDFHLRVEARINDGGNSGLFFRAPFPLKGRPACYEAQINSTHPRDMTRTGSLYVGGVCLVTVRESLVQPNDWFTEEVIAKGNQITIKVNDNETVNYRDERRRFSAGHIALQQHDPQTVVEFRKIEIKELVPQSESTAEPFPDRRAAEAMLSLGGSVTIRVHGQERGIRTGQGLPDEAFQLIRVGLDNQPELTDADLKPLEGLTNLKSLGLDKCPRVTDAGLEHLQGLAKLESLGLGNTRVSDAGLAHLERLTQLKFLALGGTRITDAGLVHLRGLTRLETLWMERTNVADAGLVHLRGLTKLKGLLLWRTKVTDAGLVHLQGLPELEEIMLGAAQVTDAGLASLGTLAQLKSLWLDTTRVTDAGLVHLDRLSNLRELNLNSTRVTDAGLVHLKRLQKLEKLHLFGTQVTSAGLALLAHLQKLEKLNLTGTHVTVTGLAHLRGLTALKELDLRDTKITEANTEELKKSLPNCKIITKPAAPQKKTNRRSRR